jgi:hypothetical protein
MRLTRWTVAVLSLAVAGALTGCTGTVPVKPPLAPSATPSGTAASSQPTSDAAPGAVPQPPGPTSAAPSPPQPSAASLGDARKIGGRPHKGQTLYLVVGDSVETEAEARAKLKAAIPLFGDVQSYFIVQRSDGFRGLGPGWWIVAEAYRSPKNAEQESSLGKRAFKDAYIKKVVVLTADPIPVYEDLVSGAGD